MGMSENDNFNQIWTRCENIVFETSNNGWHVMKQTFIDQRLGEKMTSRRLLFNVASAYSINSVFLTNIMSDHEQMAAPCEVFVLINIVQRREVGCMSDHVHDSTFKLQYNV